MRGAAVLALVVLLASCGKGSEEPRRVPPPKPRVAVQRAERREVSHRIETAGTIEAAEEISIPAGTTGTVDAVNFKEGDQVGPDTVLLEIELEKFRLAVQRAEADLRRAEAAAALAATVLDNRRTLYEEGKTQGKEWVTEEQMATWRADLLKAEADRDRARVDLEIARRDLRNARVTPPMAGIINGRMVSKGEYVRTETVVATMLNVERLYVRFTVPELDASRIGPGQEIEFSVRSAPQAGLKAAIFFMAQKSDPATRAVECKAEILRADGSAALRPGTFASVRIVTGAYQAVVVPQRAVLPTQRGFVVMVLREGRARIARVETGLWIGDGVEITAGLDPGESVIVDGASGLRDGVQVEVQP